MLKLNLKNFCHVIKRGDSVPDARKKTEGKRRNGWTAEKEVVRQCHESNENEFGQISEGRGR